MSILKIIVSLTKSFLSQPIFTHLVNHHVIHRWIPRIRGIHVPDMKLTRISLLK